MKTEEIVKRINDILKLLPKDRIAIEIEKRYSGADAIVSNFAEGIEKLQKLARDLLA